MKIERIFQVFVKPGGPLCNLDCHYCYYLKNKKIYPEKEPFRMPDTILEEYIAQHIEACSEPVIRFSWHGGEPTILGKDYFRKITELQRRHKPENQKIANGLQTNGTLLDREWCELLAAEKFVVGLSLDGPADCHDRYRKDSRGKFSFGQTMRGYELLQQFGVQTDILCVVNDFNVRNPIRVYNFFRQTGARYVSFLPLVEPVPNRKGRVSQRTIDPEAFGNFLVDIFNEWLRTGIGKIKIQIFEEAIRTAFDLEHSLCIFRKTCGDIPVVEHNGDFYSCDHYVDPVHLLGNIIETPLAELIESPIQRSFGKVKSDTLPQYCLECEVREMCHGECPRNRFISTPSGEPGLNYLCKGYRRFFTHCLPFVNEVAMQWKKLNSGGVRRGI